MTSSRIRKLALLAAGISTLSSCVIPDDTSRVAKEDVTAAAARKELVGLSEADIRMCAGFPSATADVGSSGQIWTYQRTVQRGNLSIAVPTMAMGCGRRVGQRRSRRLLQHADPHGQRTRCRGRLCRRQQPAEQPRCAVRQHGGRLRGLRAPTPPRRAGSLKIGGASRRADDVLGHRMRAFLVAHRSRVVSKAWPAMKRRTLLRSSVASLRVERLIVRGDGPFRAGLGPRPSRIQSGAGSMYV